MTKDRTITVRIEVHEVDGTVFTDLIRARKPTTPTDVEAVEVPDTRRARRAKQHEPPVLVPGHRGRLPAR